MKSVSAIAACSVFFFTAAWAQTPDAGKREFEARCAGCHGEDGTGGGHGPSIVDLRTPRATSKETAREIVHNGIPGVGMPAFALPDAELDALATYVMSLKAPVHSASAAAVPGDAEAGARFFTGKGNCSSCHMVYGRGGVLGPDLSNLGHDRSVAQIQQALTDPGSASPAPAAGRGGRGGVPAYKAVTVTLRDGKTIRGLVKNENNFELQLLGTDGDLHLLAKDRITGIVREKSLMPKVEATPAEMRDLVAYLSRLTTDTSAKSRLASGAAMGPGISFADIAHPKAGTWPTYHGNETGNRFSPLTQINTGNVAQLQPKWMFTVQGAPRPLEVTPLEVDGVMYVTTVNEAYALDARTGREIWHYSRPRTQGLAGDAASGINRGVALLGDRVFMVTDDAHLIALHRLTGQLMWDVQMADYRENYGATSAPLVVKDLVISGVSGGDEGIRGFLDAYKASTGEHVWRFWTIPAAGEPGSETWVGRALEHGCAATWLTGTYSAEDNLLFWPTGNPCPDYNGAERQGDNLYSSSILALDPDSGKLKWYYQFSPHELHDWDATETPMVVDAEFHGQRRKLLVQANRNGFFYVLDRLTGKVLLAEPFVKKLTWASGIGPDGRPQLLPGYEPNVEGVRVCPSVGGAANWPATAYSPMTGLYYVMATESCNVYSKSDEWWKAGESFYGGATRRSPEDNGGRFLRALDLQTGKIAWELPELGEGASGSGVMATAGGLVFYGDNSGAFVAVDAKSGKPLWHFNTGQPWKAAPMTYTLDGNQYIGVAAGSSILIFGLN